MTMTADILVIGSGVAATALIQKILDEHPDASIIMLEAGSRIVLKDFGLFQNYLIKNKLPTDNRSIYDSISDLSYPEMDKPGENVFEGNTPIPLNGARLFAYGGSSIHWGGWSFRLKEEDFRLADNNKLQDKNLINWPISYNDLEPWYCQAEKFIGVSGNSNDKIPFRSEDYPYREFPFTAADGLFIDAFEKFDTKIEYSNLPVARYGIPNTNSSHSPCQTTGLCKYCPFGARFVACNSLDDKLAANEYKNFKIFTDIIVEEIVMESKKEARALRCFDKSRNEEVFFEAKIIISACGAIESAKLLQRSKSQYWQNGIGNDNDLVGRNLITHPYFAYKATLPVNNELLQPEKGFPTLVSRHFDSLAEQHNGKFIIINPPSSPKADLAKMMTKGISKDDIKNAIEKNVSVQLQGLLEVFSQHDNQVSNSDKRNRFGLQETKINFSKSPLFDARIKEVEKIAGSIFEKMGAISTQIENPVSWRADHAGCTTRMSDTPEKGVVDNNLKIHEVDNLYVCSNGSFSSLGAVNPTLTLTALSIRLGHYLNNNFFKK